MNWLQTVAVVFHVLLALAHRRARAAAARQGRGCRRGLRRRRVGHRVRRARLGFVPVTHDGCARHVVLPVEPRLAYLFSQRTEPTSVVDRVKEQAPLQLPSLPHGAADARRAAGFRAGEQCAGNDCSGGRHTGHWRQRARANAC